MNAIGGWYMSPDTQPLVLCGGCGEFLVRPEVADRIRALALADGPGTVVVDMSKFDLNRPADPRLCELLNKAIMALR